MSSVWSVLREEVDDVERQKYSRVDTCVNNRHSATLGLATLLITLYGNIILGGISFGAVSAVRGLMMSNRRHGPAATQQRDELLTMQVIVDDETSRILLARIWKLYNKLALQQVKKTTIVLDSRNV